MYITSALQRTDMKAVSLQLAMDLLHQKEKRDLITGLKTRTTAGRPNWDKVFKKIQDQKKGKVTVFYCGPPQLAKTLRYKCEQFGFMFKKEIFWSINFFFINAFIFKVVLSALLLVTLNINLYSPLKLLNF